MCFNAWHVLPMSLSDVVQTDEDIPGIGSEELEAVVRSEKVKRLIVMVALGLSACASSIDASPYRMANESPRSVIACVAQLTDLPDPGTLPRIVYETREEIAQRAGPAAAMLAPENAMGLYYPIGKGVAVVASDAPFNRRPLAHELTHHVQRQAGLDPTGWKQELQAQWVERKFDAWCG